MLHFSELKSEMSLVHSGPNFIRGFLTEVDLPKWLNFIESHILNLQKEVTPKQSNPLCICNCTIDMVFKQGSTLRKNFISPAGLVTETFTSPEIFLLALILMTTLFK